MTDTVQRQDAIAIPQAATHPMINMGIKLVHTKSIPTAQQQNMMNMDTKLVLSGKIPLAKSQNMINTDTKQGVINSYTKKGLRKILTLFN